MTAIPSWRTCFAALALLALACTNDYDEFQFPGGSGGNAGSGSGGTGGAAGSAGSPACSGGDTACGAECVSLDADPNHCGACGVVCQGGFECGDGRCRCDSPGDCGDSPLADCRSDGRCECGPDNCRPGERCAGTGQLVCACNGGDSCGGDESCCPSGCADLDADEQNCGGCGRACEAGEECQGGSCQ